MVDYLEMQRVLHSPFDIATHKKTFINYLEVVILKDGTVEYSVPSHQDKLISLCADNLHCTYDEVIEIGRKHLSDWMEWLLETSGAVAVWDGGFQGHPNASQRATLHNLKIEGLYKGCIPPDRKDKV